MPTPLLIRMTIVTLAIMAVALPAHGQGYEVSLRVELQPAQPAAASATYKAMAAASNAAQVVAWLSPVGSVEVRPPHGASSPHSFVLTQKDKQFSPHLLVVPTGSAVEFPNLDPFFHNVFSLFNGRRFDLGLYEAGERRTVKFDHEGVSYIFCNIHSEMGAVILSLSTPFYAISARDGSLTMPDVPPGTYRLHLWAENVGATDLTSVSQTIHVSSQNIHLPPITLKESSAPLKPHLNKFGEEYKKPDQTPY